MEGTAKKTKLVSSLMNERFIKEQIPYGENLKEMMKDRPISYSSAKNFLISPWHFYEYYFGEKKESTSFDIGNAFELMLLEPDTVDEKIVISPEFNRRKKDEKLAEEEFKQLHKGKLVVRESELITSLDMYERAIKDPEINDWLEQAEGIQETLFYTDKGSGLRCVSKIDFRTSLEANPFKIVDVKTSANPATPDKWQKAIFSFDYWLQVGSYCHAYRSKYFVYPDFYWMVFETKPPYAFNIIKADSNMIEEGVRIWKNVLLGINFCIENNHWEKNHKFWRLMSPHDTVRMPRWFSSRV